jgi:hypothetical protein
MVNHPNNLGVVMLNKVTNIVKLQHSDAALLDKAVVGFNGSGLLRALMPIPRELFLDVESEDIDLTREANRVKFGYSDAYEFCIAEWGCTRDIDSTFLKSEVVGETAVLEFDTVDTAPFDVYERLVELGFDVVAYYWERRLGYCGIWDNGLDDFVDISHYSSETVKNLIDPELDSIFGITASIEEQFA